MLFILCCFSKIILFISYPVAVLKRKGCSTPWFFFFFLAFLTDIFSCFVYSCDLWYRFKSIFGVEWENKEIGDLAKAMACCPLQTNATTFRETISKVLRTKISVCCFYMDNKFWNYEGFTYLVFKDYDSL